MGHQAALAIAQFDSRGAWRRTGLEASSARRSHPGRGRRVQENGGVRSRGGPGGRTGSAQAEILADPVDTEAGIKCVG